VKKYKKIIKNNWYFKST